MERATIAMRHSTAAINPEKIFPVASFRSANLAQSGGGGRRPNCEGCIPTAILEETRPRALGLRQQAHPRALHDPLPALRVTLYHFMVAGYPAAG